jgi:hypothetical protein
LRYSDLKEAAALTAYGDSMGFLAWMSHEVSCFFPFLCAAGRDEEGSDKMLGVLSLENDPDCGYWTEARHT